MHSGPTDTFPNVPFFPSPALPPPSLQWGRQAAPVLSMFLLLLLPPQGQSSSQTSPAAEQCPVGTVLHEALLPAWVPSLAFSPPSHGSLQCIPSRSPASLWGLPWVTTASCQMPAVELLSAASFSCSTLQSNFGTLMLSLYTLPRLLWWQNGRKPFSLLLSEKSTRQESCGAL